MFDEQTNTEPSEPSLAAGSTTANMKLGLPVILSYSGNLGKWSQSSLRELLTYMEKNGSRICTHRPDFFLVFKRRPPGNLGSQRPFPQMSSESSLSSSPTTIPTLPISYQDAIPEVRE